MSSCDSSPSVLDELYRGRVRWDLLTPFPALPPAPDAVAELAALLRAMVDPEEVERTGQLPPAALKALREEGFLALTIDRELGGLGLSDAEAFQVLRAGASWSGAVAFTLGVGNGFGSGSYLRVLPPGPLRDMICERVAAGIVSGGADAEPAGTANRTRATVAVPVEDGAAYLISGEKVFIGNGPTADLVDVSATVEGTGEVRLFFVDTRSPGFEVTGRHEFMGLRGAAIGSLRLDRVRVPAEWLMPEDGDGWRMRPDGDGSEQTEPGPDLAGLALLGRHLVIVPAALAIAQRCLQYSRDFVARRVIDGRGLGEYEEIRRVVAATAADVFTIDCLSRWALLGRDRADTRPDLTVVKNLASRLCWRAVDRTVSLLGAEGYESAASKARRGAPPLPVERLFRDARALRVAGGVDFMLDAWSAEASLAAFYGENMEPAPQAGGGRAVFVEEQARRLAEVCARLTAAHSREELFARQRLLRVIGRIAAELLSMAVVLAAADPETAELADISCAGSRHRLAGLWSQLDHPEPGRSPIDVPLLTEGLIDHASA
ncbi:acyl-CoA dehydrogenase family protein [Nonomuraea sp. NPDC050663]|uniref:acyl-CoA dehydrogenase family protein n=1 Tax=Nonomuraea sp. NPDC050663 TaxID=3364370 RepID=UPI00378AD436